MTQSIKKINQEDKQVSRWIYVILGIIIMMFLGTLYSYSVFRFSLEKVFNIGSAASGMPYMTALAFYAIFMFLTGKYMKRFNPRTIILVGGFLVSIGWILSSFSSNIIVLTITYGCISGAGVGIAYGVPMTVVAKWFPDKKGFAVGMVLIGFGLSPLVTAPLARWLVENYGVMNTFLVLGVGFAIALPIISYPFKYPTELDIRDVKSILIDQTSTKNLETKEMIKSKSFIGLYLNFIIGTMIGLMLIGITTSVGVEFIGIEANRVIQLIVIFAIFNGLGRPVFGWLTDRLTSRKAMLLSYLLIILAAMLLIVAGKNNELVYIISFSIFWFNLGGWLAIAPASTISLYGIKNYSQNYGLVFTAYGIGAIIGVSTSGILLDIHKSYYFVFYYVIALCILGIFLTTNLISNKN
jgi:OFA family oxalate/formate antiporter-like MFS transporter